MPYYPHTDEDVQQMLAEIGVSTIDDLFSEIPQNHLLKKSIALPRSLKEHEVSLLCNQIAEKNFSHTCFLGGGCYDHSIPSAVWQTAGRGEFYSAYTPYQSEVSQGTLQTIYEFQSMMSALTAQDVSNASLYDGASALAEAILMSIRINPTKRRVLIASVLHPHQEQTIRTITASQDVTINQIGITANTKIDIKELHETIERNQNQISSLIISYPNYFGALDDIHELTNLAHKNNILVIAYVNPMVLASLSPPGEWGSYGADISCGDGQPLGIPMCGGGPSYGFITTRMKYIRQLPGRIVGKTNDENDNTGYVLTLQAREQHIRRSKATSNICTNQGLAVSASTIYLSLMGSKGIDATVCTSASHTRKLLTGLKKYTVSTITGSQFAYETTVLLPIPAKKFIEAMNSRGILAGSAINPQLHPLLRRHYSQKQINHMMQFAVTEKRSKQEIEEYLLHAKKVLC